MNHKHNTFQQEPIVKLEPNIEKIIAAISYLIAEANGRGQTLTQYDIAKALFFADRKHLNDYGRPITFDNYHAMPHGPVPTFTYDLLKGNKRALERYGKKLPWQSKKGGQKKLFYRLRTSKLDLNVLSPSDQEALSQALDIIQSLTFSQIRTLTHNDPAYLQAWNNKDEDTQSALMNLAFLFDTPNIEAAKQLAFISKHQQG